MLNGSIPWETWQMSIRSGLAGVNKRDTNLGGNRVRTCLWIPALLAIAAILPAYSEVSYNGPKPAKPDVVYLMHGDTIVETDQLEAAQSEDKKKTVYTVTGPSATARTPLSEPIFLILPGKIKPEQLSLFPMKIEKGNRVISFHTKPDDDDPQPVPLLFQNRKDGSVIIEANRYLENGEYCLSPSGANTVFCFQVY